MEKKELLRIYYLLNGIYKALKEQTEKFIYENYIDKYNDLIELLYRGTQDDYFKMFEITPDDYIGSGEACTSDLFMLKILPVLEYLYNIYIDNTEERIRKVGSLYNAIEDSELRKRCGDILLEASDAFDRAINQATQVLEDRIKKKADLGDTQLVGIPLISKAIHSKLENTILKFSEEPDIQEHYAALFKGVIGVYRNSTHHGLDYECTREQALKFCLYVDMLIKEVEKSVRI